MPLIPRAKDWKYRRNVDGSPVTDAVPVSPDDPAAAVAYVRDHFNAGWSPSQRWLDKWLPDTAVEASPVTVEPVGVRMDPDQVREDNMAVLINERDNGEYPKDRIAAAKELNRMLRDNEAKKPPGLATPEELAELIHKKIGRQMGLVK